MIVALYDSLLLMDGFGLAQSHVETHRSKLIALYRQISYNVLGTVVNPPILCYRDAFKATLHQAHFTPNEPHSVKTNASLAA